MGKVIPPHGQKVKWSIIKKYDNYEDAKQHKDTLLEEGKQVKIHRMGVGGRKFAVKVASPLKKTKQDKMAE